MQDDNFDEFSELWGGAWEMAGRNVTGRAINLAFDALAEYPLEAVRQAVMLHCKSPKGREPPKVADVVETIGGYRGTIGADEAWAIATRAADERDTVVWTPLIAEAWGQVSELYAHDEIGARMAFRQHYERAITAARAAGVQPGWYPSPGSDVLLRAQRSEEAVRLGRLSASQAALFALPAPTQGLAGLLESASAQVARDGGKSSASSAEAAGRALDYLKKMLARPTSRPADEPDAEAARQARAAVEAEDMRRIAALRGGVA